MLLLLSLAMMKAVPGMPVPRKFSTKFALKSLREKYGADCVKQMNYSDPSEFLKVFGSNGNELVVELRSVCERQAKTLREKDNEIKALRGQLRADKETKP